MLDTHVHAHRHPASSGTKRFEVHHMRRISVTLTDAAQEIINKSTRQGRVFPQALSEFFGTLPVVQRIEIDLTVDNRLIIDIKANEETLHYRFFIGADDLLQVPRNPRAGFDATRTVDELLRLYRRDVLKELQTTAD
jgi:hypothetical protein